MELPVLLELVTLSKHETERQKNTFYELHIQNENDWILIPLLLIVERIVAFKEHKWKHQSNSKSNTTPKTQQNWREREKVATLPFRSDTTTRNNCIKFKEVPTDIYKTRVRVECGKYCLSYSLFNLILATYLLRSLIF